MIAWPFSCFDTIGSPNAGYFTYDGDQSGQRNQNVAAGDVPGGSAGIERTLAGYLNLAGWRPADQPLGPGTDYFPFLTAGVPIGGMTTGAATPGSRSTRTTTPRATRSTTSTWKRWRSWAPGWPSPSVRRAVDRRGERRAATRSAAPAATVGREAPSSDFPRIKRLSGSSGATAPVVAE